MNVQQARLLERNTYVAASRCGEPFWALELEVTRLAYCCQGAGSGAGVGIKLGPGLS